jgi:ribokinase
MKSPASAQAKSPRVVVVGSLNLDLIAQVERLPSAGETVSATGLLRHFGGKGANQAVAAARQGASVTMIGCVGDDADGAAYRTHLSRREGINVSAIHEIPCEPTGTALIAVDRRGQNIIVVVAGANARLTAATVRAQAAIIRRADALLAQLEAPLPAVLEAMHIANAAGVPIVFNPSPLRADFPWSRMELHTVIVNELEARQIFSRSVGKLARTAPAWRRALARRHIAQLLVTRGAQSTLCLTAGKCFAVPTQRVRPVDTVGAGDTFAGTFTARLAEGCSLAEAVAFANCAGALATLKPGAQEAMPTRLATQRARLTASGGGRNG